MTALSEDVTMLPSRLRAWPGTRDDVAPERADADHAPIGLDERDEAAYAKIVSHPGTSTEKAAVLLGMDEVTAYRVLDRLAGLGLVAHEAGGGWTAIEPDVALAGLLARQQAGLARHQQQVEDSRLMVARLLAAHGQRRTGDPVGIEWLIGGEAVWSRLSELADDCQEECVSLRPVGLMSGRDLDSPRAIDQGLLDRGIRSRSIVLDAVRNDRPALGYLRREAEAGAEVRTLPTLPARIRIFDRSHVLVPVDSLTGITGALIVSCDAIVESFVMLFSMLWVGAEPLAGQRVRRPGGLSSQEAHILRLWAQGHTDASAARRMQVSLRTVRRLSDQLTERLGAHSRFQLGAAAMARRLIDPAEVS